MTAVPRTKRRLGWRKKLLFVVVLGLSSTLVTALLLEVGFRTFWTPPALMAEFQQKGLYRELPDGSAGLQPGYRGTLQLTPDEPVTTVAVNSLGMRGAEPGAKRAGERRLLCLGDSMVFGYGVDQEQTFASRLEAALRAGGRDVTVGNGGISGFNTLESARRLAHLRPGFQPDAALFCIYLGNDAIENRNSDTVVVGGLRFAGTNARLMQRSMRARWMARSRFLLWLEGWLVVNKADWSLLSVWAADTGSPTMAGFPDKLDAGLFLDVKDENTSWPAGGPPVLPRALADFRAGLEQAKAAAGGMPLHVLILPMWCHCSATDHEAALRAIAFDPAAFRRGAIQERLARLCGELGLPVMDATPWLEAAGDTRSLFVSDKGHLSPRGNEVLAAHLAKELAPLWQ